MSARASGTSEILYSVAGSPAPPTVGGRVEDALRRRLEGLDWIVAVTTVESLAELRVRPGLRYVRRRISAALGTCWAQVSWIAGGVERDELVRMAMDLAETRLREDDLLEERNAMWERVEGLQERMVERKRMMAIGTMAAGVAHDIRTPLSVLVANLSYLEHIASELPGISDELESIADDNRLALDLIMGVLDSMRTFVESGDAPSVFKVGPVVQSAVRLTRWHFARNRSKVEVSIEGDPTAVGTHSEFCQILLNLLSNSAEAAPAGSVVRVVARPNGDETRVWVADEGPGVADDQAEAIFEPFHTSKAQGMGLGLSLAREMARRHGGELRLLTVTPLPLGRPAPAGACFELRVPSHVQSTRLD